MHYSCDNCKKLFADRHSKSRHMKKCTVTAFSPIFKREFKEENEVLNGKSSFTESYAGRSTDVSYDRFERETIKFKGLNTEYEHNDKQKTNQTKESDSFRESHTSYGNCSDGPDIKLAFLSTDIFKEMTELIGYDNTISFLTISTMKCDLISVVKKVYFTGNTKNYPIVLQNNHYRYLNTHQELIDNINSSYIIECIFNLVHNALIKANVEVIRTRISHGIYEGDTVNGANLNFLYDVYNICTIQNNLVKVLKMKHKVKKDFDDLINLKQHPFFEHERTCMFVK